MKGSVAEQAQIQSQLDSMVNGEQSQVVSLRAQLAEAKYNLDQTTVRAPSDGYITQVLIRPGTYAAVAAAAPGDGLYSATETANCRPVPPELAAQAGGRAMMPKRCLTPCQARYSTVNWSTYLPVVPGGTYQAQGSLQSLTRDAG